MRVRMSESGEVWVERDGECHRAGHVEPGDRVSLTDDNGYILLEIVRSNDG